MNEDAPKPTAPEQILFELAISLKFVETEPMQEIRESLAKDAHDIRVQMIEFLSLGELEIDRQL